MTEEKQRILKAEEIWLNYFNDYLFSHQVISRKEYLRMIAKIAEYCERKRRMVLSEGVSA